MELPRFEGHQLNMYSTYKPKCHKPLSTRIHTQLGDTTGQNTLSAYYQDWKRFKLPVGVSAVLRADAKKLAHDSGSISKHIKAATKRQRD